MKYPITSQRLIEALNDKSMSAQELSNRTGIAKSSISGYVNGVHTIGNVNAIEIGKILGVSPMWLMEFDSPKYDLFDVEANNKAIHKYNEDLYIESATTMYAKYLAQDSKTRRIIDQLLESDD